MKPKSRRRTQIAALATYGLIALAVNCPSAHGQFYRGGQSPYPGGGISGGVSSSAYDTSGLQQFNMVNGIPLFIRPYLPMMTTSSAYADPVLRFPNFATPGGYTTGGVCAGYTCTTGGFSNYATTTPAAYGPRSAFDRWTFDRDRQASSSGPQKQIELQRLLTNPSLGDVTCGLALNAIVDSLEPLVEKFKDLPPTAIDHSLLKKMNFTHGAGSVGLLRHQGKIQWPALLLNLAPADEVAKIRTKIEGQLQEVYRQASEKGKADPEDLKNLLRSIDNLGDIASGQAQSMTFSQNVEVKRYLKSLEDCVAFLKQSDAGDWLPGKHKVKPDSVQDFVRILIQQKVRFAPAIVGDDAAYAAMHRSLAALYAQAIKGGG